MAPVDPSTGTRTSAANDDCGVHRRFAAGMVRLGAWYVRHLVDEGRIGPARIADALTRRANLYRLTTLWDGRHDPALGDADPRWDALVTELVQVVRSAPFDEVETRVLALLDPWLANAPDPPPDGAFGCFWYRVAGEGIGDGPGALGRLLNPRKLWEKVRRLAGAPAPPRHAELHFFNAVAPRSPFDEPLQLARALAALVADCQRRHPAVQRLWCSSWLNNRAQFLALFPDSWRASAVERSQDERDAASFGRARLNTDNWWGQFVRRDGSLNEVLARRFRDSGGVFPFPNLRCSAPIAAVARHLAARIGRLEQETGPC